MKIRILGLILLIVFLSAGFGVYIYWKNAPGEEEYRAAALAYLEKQKAALYGAETIPKEVDPQTDSLGFLLYLCGGSGAMYPEVKEAFSEGVIRQLQNEIVFGDQDVVTFSNGYLEAIDIKTPETAEMLFACIRNCVQITDLSDASLEPMALPIEINGEGCGTFDIFFATYQETGQFIGISFSPEDSENFYKYVMDLTHFSK